ncbi:hypothetical protein Ancab_024624 [Ancistrocladus abbreviatus]
MEESSEVQSEDNKSHPEKNKKRRFKTPSQVQALEEFYNEHKYPSESMKAELAEKLGLTEKQVSGWFCHRRLKDKRLSRDEGYATGRQDLSSGVVQDRGSGLRQDSCGSTKQGDHRPADLREVESRRLCGADLPTTEPTYDPRRHYEISGMDDTSSQSDSDIPESFYPQGRDLLEMETSKYVVPNGFIDKSRGRRGPSGYLKIKGQTENSAITAVKRQLGRHYQEDGPPLGVDFDPVPPGAFESLNKHTIPESYKLADPSLSGSLDISGPRKKSSLSNMRNPDSYMEARNFRPLHGSELDNLSYRCHSKKKMLISPTHGNSFPVQKSSFSVDEYSAPETSVYDSSIDHSVRSKHGLKGRRPESSSNHRFRPATGKITGEQTEPWLYDYDNMDTKVLHKERLETKPSSFMVRCRDSLDTEERVLSARITEEEDLYGDRRATKEQHDPIRVKMHPTNEIRAGKRGRDEVRQQNYAVKTAFQEIPQWTKPIKGSAAELPSSFSEDETAGTSSSVD